MTAMVNTSFAGAGQQGQAQMKLDMEVQEKILEDAIGAEQQIEEQKEAAEKAKREKALQKQLAKEKADQLAKQHAQARKAANEKIAAINSDKKAQLKTLKEKAKSLAAEFKNEKAKLKIQLKDEIAKADGDETAINAAKEKYDAAILELKDKQTADKEEQAAEKIKIQEQAQKEIAQAKLEMKQQLDKVQVEKLNLPEDNTKKLNVSKIEIRGNIIVDDNEIMAKMPLIFSASDLSVTKADSKDLYDFSELQNIMLMPGDVKQVSARTIQGFTQYILSLYQESNYAGIYVFVPADALENGELKNNVLLIEVLEAPVTDVDVKTYDKDQNVTEKGYLKTKAVQKWSPVKPGEVANQKELDDFVNLLNLNPDRYVSAVVTKGSKPKSLAVAYDIYEVSPWHFYTQLDNSGTEDRRWRPRIGMINTNLFGYDDTFQIVYQTCLDSGFDRKWSLYGSYDLPLAGPKLRLRVDAGYSQNDSNPDHTTTDYHTNSSFIKGMLRYNAAQFDAFGKNNWFVDVLGGMSYETSKNIPSIPGAPAASKLLETELQMSLWHIGVELYRKDDLSKTSFTFMRTESLCSGSNGTEFVLTRPGGKQNTDFVIYEFNATHNQYLDPNRVHKVAGSFKWVAANGRLVPSKMMSFGGMYTVRGYDEQEAVGDGGILASFQYEFDIVKYNETKNPEPETADPEKEVKKPFLRKLAPLCFIDYGNAKINHPLATEHGELEMCSIGVGLLTQLGDHFSGTLYYGFPLMATDHTRRGKGRLNVGFLMRW